MSSNPSLLPEQDLEIAACALCGGSEHRHIFRGRDVRRGVPGEFSVVRCQGCGLVYVNPRPTPQAIARYYPQGYSHHESDFLPFQRHYYALFRRPPVPPGSRVLDVGCGGGRYLQILREWGYQAAGLDVNSALVERLCRDLSLEAHTGLLTDDSLPEASFDLVALWWMLEHTHDPLDTLRAARRVLRPGGRLAVGVPNFDSLARRLFGSSWHHVDLPTHLYHFEPRTLDRALRAAGFRVDRIRQDLLAKEFAPSLGYALGLSTSLDRGLLNLLALPFDLLSWVVRKSGLMTAFATRD